MTIEEIWAAQSALVDELCATHGMTYTTFFIEEHWNAIQAVLDRMMRIGTCHERNRFAQPHHRNGT
jgi:hypothetical protein